jgi:hypothetical protein
MIELWHDGHIVAIYEPVGCSANNCGVLVMQNQYRNNGHTAWVDKADCYTFSDTNYDSCRKLGGAIERKYYRDSNGDLWRDCDSDNFHLAIIYLTHHLTLV